MNLLTEEHHLTFGETPSIDYYASKLSTWLTRGLYPPGLFNSYCFKRIIPYFLCLLENDEDEEKEVLSRPMACGMLLSCYDSHRQKCRLVRVDNNGYVSDCLLGCMGSVSVKSADQIFDIINTPMEEDDQNTPKCTRLYRIVKKVGDFIMSKLVQDKGLNDLEQCMDCECIVVNKSSVRSSSVLKFNSIIRPRQRSSNMEDILKFIEQISP
jgi:hypothetical protein